MAYHEHKTGSVDLSASVWFIHRFTKKTTEHILKLREKFQGQTIFGRSDVMRVLDMKASRASELLKDMAEQGIIEPVSGFGKGKYRFRRSRPATT